MIIRVRAVPNSRTESVERVGESEYRVKVREKAVRGEANAAVARALAAHFHVRESDVAFVRGLRGREKTVEISLPARAAADTDKY